MKTRIRDSYTPKLGDYCNTLVIDKETGNQYLFDADGVWTLISTDEEGIVAEAVAQANAYTDDVAEGKVDKEEGKGLSENDFTDEDKEKLDDIEEGAQENVIEVIKRNGAALPVTDKTVDIAVPTTTSSLTNDSGYITNEVDDLVNYYDKDETDTLIATEAETRDAADLNLQEQIDAISSASDVVDVVGTYAELQNYDTSKLGDNDIIKVLTDETHDDAISYYRWNDTTETFTYIGSQGPFYTKSETDATFVPQTRTINGKGLNSDVVLTAADVNALPASTVIPTVNDATLTIQKNGATVQTFTANQATNATANIVVPTKTSDLTNDGSDNTSTYVESDELAAVATSGSYNDLTDKPTIDFELVEMSYGESNAWAKFIDAYRGHKIVYCRASSNSNPATGSQTRKAFMAYVNNAENPTEVEFQYVRSVSTKTSSQPVDQVFVYKLTNANGGTWTVQTRDMGPKLARGTNTTVSYANGTYTISATQPTVNDATLTIKKNGSSVGTFTANSSTNTDVDITVPTKTSDLTNDSGFITKNVSDLTNYYTQSEVNGMFNALSIPTKTSDLVNDSGFLTSIPIASATTLGGVKIGSGLNVAADGTISAAVASLDWANITNKPTDVSYWTNDAGYITSAALPTKTSDLTNDSGFITSADVPTKTSDLTNDSGFITSSANNLTNYYKKSETYTQGEVNSLLSAIVVPTKTSDLTNDGADGTSTYVEADDLATVATSGSYTDLSNRPTIGNATLTIQRNGTNVQTFTANATSNKTANITVPTKTSDLTNDSNFVSNTDYATASTGGVVKVGSGLEITNGVLSATGGGTADAVEWDNVLNKPTFSTVATSGSYNDLADKPTIPTVNNATLTIQKNSTSVGTFTANASSNKTINITVPTTAADVSALPASTKYGASITVSLNTTDYKMTTTLKDQDGNTLGTAQTIDLPLESVVVNGSYDSTNKKIVLTLQSGSTIDIPVGDLVAGLQSEITSTNKLASDLVDDTNQTHKFMTSAEKTKLSGIAAGAEVNVQANWTQTTTTADDYIKNKPTLATVATSGSYNDLSNKPTIPTVNNATLTIQKNGTNVQTFTANQSTNATANITVPTKTSELTNDSSFVTSSGTVAKANQLTTARTIAISGGATGTATSFNGTSNISIPITGMYETYLNWGNQNLSGRVSPIDTAMSEEFSANRLAYMDASKITVEYSRDGGSTWVDYGLTAAQKTGLVTTSQAIYTGGTSSNAASNYRVRVNLNPTNPYMATRKLFVYISTGGVSGAQVLVERKSMGGTSYETVTTATISGWSGWNSIPINITFGGSASWSNSDLRLTFSYSGKSTSYPNAQLQISKIRLYGETAWSAPSNLATNGHMYTYDTSQNVTFPANVNVTGSLGHGSYTYTLPNKNGTVAMTSDIPSVPTVNNGQLTIQKNGTNVTTFTANQSGNVTANITVPTKTSDLTNDSGFLDSVAWGDVTGKPTFATVATSGSYNDLSNKPTIPTVNNATLTIQKNGTTVKTFTANASSNVTANITVPTTVAELSDASTYVTQNNLVTQLANKQNVLTAGDHINITGSTIKAVDYVHSEQPVSTSAVTPVVTGSMISNGTITADKLASGATLKLTLSTSDIGEGSALAANTLYGVYQ